MNRNRQGVGSNVSGWMCDNIERVVGNSENSLF